MWNCLFVFAANLRFMLKAKVVRIWSLETILKPPVACREKRKTAPSGHVLKALSSITHNTWHADTLSNSACMWHPREIYSRTEFLSFAVTFQTHALVVVKKSFLPNSSNCRSFIPRGMPVNKKELKDHCAWGKNASKQKILKLKGNTAQAKNR